MTSKSHSTILKSAGIVIGLALFVFVASFSFGQQITGTLSGISTDSSGAVIPNAKVTMVNEESGDTRTTTSNGSGYFVVTAVQPGSYKVNVSAPGFKAWEVK